ncbi:hypothetical protein L218DRAFT_1000938 [Marasmius fiardii PR-910]|nr:hypothetical protein L218DRAFT_1000938 [Marasmius fiardii PR-910]
MPTTKSPTLFSRSSRVPLSNITNYQDDLWPSQSQPSPLHKKQVSQASVGIYDIYFQSDPFHSMSDSYYCSELESTYVSGSFEDLDNFSVYRRGGQTRSVATRSVSHFSDVFKFDKLEKILLGEEEEFDEKASCDLTETESIEITPKRECPVIPLGFKATSLGIIITPPTPTKADTSNHQERANLSQWISDDDWNASGYPDCDLDEPSDESFDWVTIGDGAVEYRIEDANAQRIQLLARSVIGK